MVDGRLQRLLEQVKPNRFAVTEDYRSLVEAALSKLGCRVEDLVEEARSIYRQLTYQERKVVGYLLTFMAEEAARRGEALEVGDLCRGLDYAFVEARGVHVKGRSAGDFCGFKARSSTFEFEEVGYGFLSHSIDCVGFAKRAGLNAGFKAVNCRLSIG